ncbi:hypothetical protein U9M48_016144 [Paspalum notatum var. saurae]|uniref:Reverse transcriptase zinc-binding domain-containing protein n=1 Tax=Paspalum notatum var. saurae TaxID=547442 RepID=A0AAQ3T6K3_PASNO
MTLQSHPINEEARNERYLGLPITVGKSKKRTFEYIKNKIWARIRGWQEKLLWKAEKKILMKAVAQTIPAYAIITRKSITPRGSSLFIKLSELIDPATSSWDEQLIRDTFWPEDVQEILTIPVDTDATDWPAWHFDSTGNFSVKSAYNLAVHIRDRDLGKDASSSTAAAVSAHNSLPVRRNLARRGVKTDTICPMCHRLDEDCDHVFFRCKRSKECWEDMNLEHIRAILETCKSGK